MTPPICKWRSAVAHALNFCQVHLVVDALMPPLRDQLGLEALTQRHGCAKRPALSSAPPAPPLSTPPPPLWSSRCGSVAASFPADHELFYYTMRRGGRMPILGILDVCDPLKSFSDP
jgi:hypothetical protein